MASDNILSALIGVLEGSQRGANKFLEDHMARRRRREELEQMQQGQLDLLQAKAPIEREQAQFESNLISGRNREQAQIQSELQLGRERTLRAEEPTVPLYVEKTQQFIQPPGGSKRFEVLREPILKESTEDKELAKKLLRLQKLAVPGFDLTGEVEPSPTEAAKLRTGKGEFDTFMNDIQGYKNLITQYGPSEITDRYVQSQLKAAAKNLQLKVKNLAQLGVLSFSDIPFIEEQIPDPSIFTTSAGAMGALDQAEKAAKVAFKNNMSSHGYQERVPVKNLTPQEKAARREELLRKANQ